MRIKMGKDTLYSIIVFISLLVAMQLAVSRIILLFAIVVLLIIGNYLSSGKLKNTHLKGLQKICRVELFCLALFVGLQIIVLGLDLNKMATDIAILSCVFIGVICGSLCMKMFRSFETYLRAILFFLILFSLYYILDIILHGLPEGRNSVLGNVSSNYCSTILFLNYPVLFYYLYVRNEKEKRDKKLVKYCYAAIILSLIVIVSSGSRTAIGVVAIMIAQMLLYKNGKVKDKIKFFALAILGLLVILLAYNYNPSVHALITRGMDAFGGRTTLSSDVRQLIWKAGLQQFFSGNVVFGQGTSVVTRFDRPAHNLFYEVLMCTGYVGIALFALIFAILIIYILINQKNKQRFLSIMLLVAVLIVAWVQPFFSTSYTCGMMMWMSLFSLTADAEYCNVHA